jgi:hypothetical protein
VRRRTFDILVLVAYVLALAVSMIVGDRVGVGGVAVIGAVCVIAYFIQLRQYLKA